MAGDDEITRWIEPFKAGDDTAVQHLWDAFYPRLVRVARKKLGGIDIRSSDEEDVAVSAFHSFYQGVANGRIPKLEDRHDLWNVLLTITQRKSYAHVKRKLAAKRGGGTTRGESVFARAGQSGEPVGLDQLFANAPTSEFTDDIISTLDELLTGLDDQPRRIAQLKMEGYTNAEIAEKLDISTRAVTRKLGVIRLRWLEEDRD